jgi:hypothetical protein
MPKGIFHGLDAVLRESVFGPSPVSGDDRCVAGLIPEEGMKLLWRLWGYSIQVLGLQVACQKKGKKAGEEVI